MSQAFKNMTDFLQTPTEHRFQISSETYKKWQNQWIFDAMIGKRYGQSFCDFFGISNATPLYYFKNQDTCERWIKGNYIER